MLADGGGCTCAGCTTVGGGHDGKRVAQPLQLIASASSITVLSHLSLMGIPFDLGDARRRLAFRLAGLLGRLQRQRLVLGLRTPVPCAVGLVARPLELVQHAPLQAQQRDQRERRRRCPNR